jgi:hypothetical protein
LTRLKEVNKSLIQIQSELIAQKQNFFEITNYNTTLIANILGEIAKKIE